MINHYREAVLTAYYADLATIEPLSQEQHDALLAAAAQRGQHLDQETRNQLVQAHLMVTKNLAIRYCPQEYSSLLPDILGNLNLSLLQAADRFDLSRGSKLRTYLCSFVEGAVKRTIKDRRVIRITDHGLQKAFHDKNQEGQRINRLEPLSFEEVLQRREKEGEDLAMWPLLPTEELPEADAELQRRVNDWLTHLSVRDEKVVRLYFGLTERDEHCYTVAEIASLLDLPYDAIHAVVDRSLLRLQMVATGTAELRERGGRQVVAKVFHAQPPPVLTPEQESQLLQTGHDLCAQGMTISGQTLSTASGLSLRYTFVFLQQHRQDFPPEAFRGTAERRLKQKERQREVVKERRPPVVRAPQKRALPVLTPEQESHLLQAGRDLCAQGMTISGQALRKASGLSLQHTMVFLQQHRQDFPPEALRGTAEYRLKHRERQPPVVKVPQKRALPVLTAEQESQLLQVGRDLCAQGMTVSTRTLHKASGLSARHTMVFLQQHREDFPPETFRGAAEYREKRQQERLSRVEQ